MVWRNLQWIAAVVGAVTVLIGGLQLEGHRAGLVIEPLVIEGTPATIYRRARTATVAQTVSPAVIITHGFAGSRQLMEAYALTLAQAGYIAVSFDFEGHGRNPRPMSGDITKVEGTTQRLMREIGRVSDAVVRLPYVDGRIALLGHSMASDIIVRQAIADERVAATVAISMFSEAVTSDKPRNLLIITGAWEGFLRDEALRALQKAKATATEGETIGVPSAGTGRRAVAAPGVEHVGVLYSATGMREARTWLDAVFGRTSSGDVAATGGWIALLLAGIVILAWPLTALLPQSEAVPDSPSLGTFLLAVFAPVVMTPLLLSVVETRFLPVLVADYLAVHLLVYGVIALAVLVWGRVWLRRIDWVSGLALAAYGIVIFGGALDRYGASFMPGPDRLPIIAAIALGAVPYMIADSLLSECGRAPIWRILMARTAFVGSLGVAVALDFERLFFLLIIMPVIAVFFIIFGLMGGWVGRRTRSPMAAGLGLGLILAWALGVSFPLFVAA